MELALQSGVVIGGDYRIGRPLGEGGMGAVYVAEQLSTGKLRALKLMKTQLVSDEKSRLRFVEEAKVGSRIDSAHVVEVVGAGIDEASGMPWLAMELLDGEDLEQRVKRTGPLPLDEVGQLFSELAHALGEAHGQGIIHRDLKPENLFLAKSRRFGSASVLKVLDFGIASFVSDDKTAATVTSAIGSPLWVAPEQTRTGSKLRPSTDVWAMGLIAFYLLTGRSYWPAAEAEPFNLTALLAEILAHPLPLASQRARSLGFELPAGFDDWFARCVVREPEARFADATLAAHGLQELAATPGSEPGAALPRTVRLARAVLPDAQVPATPSKGGADPLSTVSEVEPPLPRRGSAANALRSSQGSAARQPAMSRVRPDEGAATRGARSRIERVLVTGQRWLLLAASLGSVAGVVVAVVMADVTSPAWYGAAVGLPFLAFALAFGVLLLIGSRRA